MQPPSARKITWKGVGNGGRRSVGCGKTGIGKQEAGKAAVLAKMTKQSRLVSFSLPQVSFIFILLYFWGRIPPLTRPLCHHPQQTLGWQTMRPSAQTPPLCRRVLARLMSASQHLKLQSVAKERLAKKKGKNRKLVEESWRKSQEKQHLAMQKQERKKQNPEKKAEMQRSKLEPEAEEALILTLVQVTKWNYRTNYAASRSTGVSSRQWVKVRENRVIYQVYPSGYR